MEKIAAITSRRICWNSVFIVLPPFFSFLLLFFFVNSPRDLDFERLVKPVFDRTEVRPAISGPCPSPRPRFISGTALATFETSSSLGCVRRSREAFFRALSGVKSWPSHRRRRPLKNTTTKSGAFVMKALSLFGPDLISRVRSFFR